MRMKKLVVSVMIASPFFANAYADATLQFKVTTNQPKATPKIQTVFVKGGKFMVRAAGGDPGIDLLYDRSVDTMYVINHARKSYITFDEKAVQQLGQAAAMVAALQRQLAEKMKDMPPEKQERLRKMLGDIGNPAPAAEAGPRSVKQLGNRSVGGIPCRQMAVFRGKTKYSEMCIAQPNSVGLSSDDMQTIKALQAFQERVWSQAAKISNQMGGHMPEFGGRNINGVPIEMQDFVGPAPTTMTVMKAGSGVGGKVLDLPAGYQAASLPAMGGGKPRQVPRKTPQQK